MALRFGGDLTLPEVAALTGLELSTVEGRVYRALRKLRVAIASELGINRRRGWCRPLDVVVSCFDDAGAAC